MGFMGITQAEALIVKDSPSPAFAVKVLFPAATEEQRNDLLRRLQKTT